MKYESFSLRIEPGPDSSYAVSVQSPQGEGQGTFQIPEAPARSAGQELFRALFRGEVASLFHTSLGSLREPRQGLRINIAIDPRRPELAPLQKLPWERLCRPETEDFLCLSLSTPIVRSLDAHRERRSAITRPRRLRILVVAASPTDGPALDVAQELAHLKAAWKDQEKSVEIVFLKRGGVEEMRQAFLAAPFHILHFMGHGEVDEDTGEGMLFFERQDGTSQLFEGRRLAQMLHDFKSLRLVVLNACHSAEAVGRRGPNPFAGVGSALVMGGVPAVVAMTGLVSDVSAVAFSRTFYQRLAAGDPIEAAMTEGRLAIQRADPEDGAWAIPALFLRSADGNLFAPPSVVWARRAALLAGFALALSLLLLLATGWRREHRTAEAARFTNDGAGLLGLGREQKARESIRSALKSDPHNAAALGNLAVVEVQLGDDEAALRHARAAVQAAPEEAVHHYNLGNLLARKKRYEEALPSLQRAIELDPDYAYAYNEIGNIYLELDRPSDARKALEAGLSRDPKVSKLHKNLARTALAERRPEEAILQLEKALSLCSPTDLAGRIEAMYWLAAAQAAAGHVTEACGALRDLKVLDPHQLSPFAKRATLLAGQQRCAP